MTTSLGLWGMFRVSFLRGFGFDQERVSKANLPAVPIYFKEAHLSVDHKEVSGHATRFLLDVKNPKAVPQSAPNPLELLVR